MSYNTKKAFGDTALGEMLGIAVFAAVVLGWWLGLIIIAGRIDTNVGEHISPVLSSNAQASSFPNGAPYNHASKERDNQTGRGIQKANIPSISFSNQIRIPGNIENEQQKSNTDASEPE
jgi:hypothetical protein